MFCAFLVVIRICIQVYTNVCQFERCDGKPDAGNIARTGLQQKHRQVANVNFLHSVG